MSSFTSHDDSCSENFEELDTTNTKKKSELLEETPQVDRETCLEALCYLIELAALYRDTREETQLKVYCDTCQMRRADLNVGWQQKLGKRIFMRTSQPRLIKGWKIFTTMLHFTRENRYSMK